MPMQTNWYNLSYRQDRLQTSTDYSCGTKEDHTIVSGARLAAVRRTARLRPAWFSEPRLNEVLDM
jgi:hypothetical protein